MKLAICMPCMDMMPVESALSLAGLVGYIARGPDFSSLEIIAESRCYIEEARSRIASRALAAGAQWLLWLDSDMTYPPDIAHRLLKSGKAVTACNYAKRQTPVEPVAIDFEDRQISLDRSGLIKAKAAGLGVCLTSADVFSEGLEPPYFRTEWRKDKDGHKLAGEDGLLFADIRDKCWEDLHIDCDASKEVSHIGLYKYRG